MPLDLTFEPDLPPGDTEFHKRIVATVPMEGSRTGKHITLECGHEVLSFGDVSHTGGRVLCLECMKAAAQPEPLTRAKLHREGCGTPNCGHDHSVLYFHARCHPHYGVDVSYSKITANLTIKCKKCGAFVAEVAVAE